MSRSMRAMRDLKSLLTRVDVYLAMVFVSKVIASANH